jgi:6-phosphofructokinase
MRVALLTGGGDCPGLNAVIYAAVRKGINHYGDEFIGFLNGWRGVLDNNFIPLTLEAVDGIQLKGGTILHSSRTNVKKIPGGIDKVQEVLKANKIDALIALGGDDTQSVTLFLSENGVNAVGVPKTIDNDISGTDQTFGYDTAVMIATEAVDRIHTTADSHNRVIVIEVMGRDAGWIAYASGTAGGAHVILVPEKEIDIDHVCALLKYNYDHGKHTALSWSPRAAICLRSARSSAPSKSTPSATSASPALAKRSPSSSRRRPATKPVPSTSATPSAAAFPRPSTASSGSATASTQSTWCTRRSGAASRSFTAPTSPTSRSRKRSQPTASSTSDSST